MERNRLASCSLCSSVPSGPWRLFSVPLSLSPSRSLCSPPSDIFDYLQARITASVADPDPGTGAFLTPGAGIREG